MADDYDMVDRLEKQMEGSNLALAAVAEVLQKMDSRISKEEDYELDLAQEEDDAFEKQEIIKAVATQVYGLIKADQGMDGLGGDKVRKAKSLGKGDDDSERAITPVKAMGDQQATIQAMQKQLNMLKAGYGLVKDDEDEEDDEDYAENEDEVFGEDNGEDNEDDDDALDDKNMRYAVENSQEYPILEHMQKQISALTKAFKNTKGSKGGGNMQKAIQVETENRLRKMGFREETSLTRPTVIRYEDSIGLDGTAPIRKESSPQDTVDQMMQLSYQDLRRLQETIENGETDGIPRELLG